MITINLTGEQEQTIRDLAAKAQTTAANFAHEVLTMWLMGHRTNKFERDPMDYSERSGDSDEGCHVHFRQRMMAP